MIPVHALGGSTVQGTLLACKQQHSFRITASRTNIFWRDFWRPSVRQAAESRGSYVGLPGLCPVKVLISPKLKTPKPSEHPSSVFDHPCGEQFFPTIWSEFPMLQAAAHPSTGHLWKSVDKCSPHPSPRNSRQHWVLPEASLQAGQSQQPQPPLE